MTDVEKVAVRSMLRVKNVVDEEVAEEDAQNDDDSFNTLDRDGRTDV